MRICNVHKINAYFIAIIVFIELLLSMLLVQYERITWLIRQYVLNF